MSYGKLFSNNGIQTQSIAMAGIFAFTIGVSMTACDRSLDSVTTSVTGTKNDVAGESVELASDTRPETRGVHGVVLGGGGDFEAAGKPSHPIADARDWETAPATSIKLAPSNNKSVFRTSQPADFDGIDNNQFQATRAATPFAGSKTESGGDFATDAVNPGQPNQPAGQWANQDAGSLTTRK